MKTGRLSPAMRRNIAGYLFIAPALIGLLLFYAFPMIFSLFISFTDWNLRNAPNAQGLKNYMQLAADPVFLKSVRVTFYYTLLAVPVSNVYALLMALLLNMKFRGRSVVRTIFYIPSIVPAVAAAGIWMYIFNPYNGFLNQIVPVFGMDPQMWIYSPTQVIPCLVVMTAWGAGGTAVIYLAALQGVPQILYESVSLDGGNAFDRFFHITVPMISPIIFYNVIMGVINSMQIFTQGYIMTKGG
ncbi:MAG: sugar ABC transporter permease, partial [Lachnospiraceae bacterium]|nr:sugar ABC transporter permease [Lachnospiraceae bacterium]